MLIASAPLSIRRQWVIPYMKINTRSRKRFPHWNEPDSQIVNLMNSASVFCCFNRHYEHTLYMWSWGCGDSNVDSKILHNICSEKNNMFIRVFQRGFLVSNDRCRLCASVNVGSSARARARAYSMISNGKNLMQYSNIRSFIRHRPHTIYTSALHCNYSQMIY